MPSSRRTSLRGRVFPPAISPRHAMPAGFLPPVRPPHLHLDDEQLIQRLRLQRGSRGFDWMLSIYLHYLGTTVPFFIQWRAFIIDTLLDPSHPVPRSMTDRLIYISSLIRILISSPLPHWRPASFYIETETGGIDWNGHLDWEWLVHELKTRVIELVDNFKSQEDDLKRRYRKMVNFFSQGWEIRPGTPYLLQGQLVVKGLSVCLRSLSLRQHLRRVNGFPVDNISPLNSSVIRTRSVVSGARITLQRRLAKFDREGKSITRSEALKLYDEEVADMLERSVAHLGNVDMDYDDEEVGSEYEVDPDIDSESRSSEYGQPDGTYKPKRAAKEGSRFGRFLESIMPTRRYRGPVARKRKVHSASPPPAPPASSRSGSSRNRGRVQTQKSR